MDFLDDELLISKNDFVQIDFDEVDALPDLQCKFNKQNANNRQNLFQFLQMLWTIQYKLTIKTAFGRRPFGNTRGK